MLLGGPRLIHNGKCSCYKHSSTPSKHFIYSMILCLKQNSKRLEGITGA